MENNKFDIKKVYFGVETYIEVDDRGINHYRRELYPYLLKHYYECENKGVYKFYNLETFEQLYINQDGNVLDYDVSSKEDIISISGIHSLVESAGILLDIFEEYGYDDSESVIDFDLARAIYSESETYEVDASCASAIVNSALTIYQLCYGNPISHESRMRCLFRYYNDVIEKYNC